MRDNPSGEVANVLVLHIEVSEFEHQSRYYVQFCNNMERYKTLISVFL